MERQVLISVLVVFFGVGFGFSSGAWGQVVWYVDDDGAGDWGRRWVGGDFVCRAG